MGNSHWSQSSHRLNVFGLNGVAILFSFPMALFIQVSKLVLVFLVLMWVYIIFFENYLKMPLRCSPAMIRTWITGTNKESKNQNSLF